MVNVNMNVNICAAYAALGGVLEVLATAVLACPAAQLQEGIYWSEFGMQLMLGLNLVLQILASLAANLVSTWYGPIAVAGPVFFAAQLVANLVVFWLVLGIENFTKEMQIGTYVVVVAVALLLRVGPGVQDDQDFEALVTEPIAAAWSLFLVSAMFLTSIPLIPNIVDMRRLPTWKRFFILLTVRATSFSLNLTTGRAVILEASKTWLLVSIAMKVLSGAIYTRALVVQSTTVEQAKFVPINAVVTLLAVAITGILVWEDYLVVRDWTGYVCVFLLFVLGSFLLLSDIQPLSESNPRAFRATFSVAGGSGRRSQIKSIRRYSYYAASRCRDSVNLEHCCPESRNISRRLSKVEAWKNIFRPSVIECGDSLHFSMQNSHDSGSFSMRSLRQPAIPTIFESVASGTGRDSASSAIAGAETDQEISSVHPQNDNQQESGRQAIDLESQANGNAGTAAAIIEEADISTDLDSYQESENAGSCKEQVEASG